MILADGFLTAEKIVLFSNRLTSFYRQVCFKKLQSSLEAAIIYYLLILLIEFRLKVRRLLSVSWSVLFLLSGRPLIHLVVLILIVVLVPLFILVLLFNNLLILTALKFVTKFLQLKIRGRVIVLLVDELTDVSSLIGLSYVL